MHTPVKRKCIAVPCTLEGMPNPIDLSAVLSDNLAAMMAASAGLRTQTAVAKATSGVVNQTTVSRILKRQISPTAATIAALAAAFGIEPWQMLVPEIDPANLPVLRTPRGAEAEFYRRMQQLAAELGINGKP